MLSLILNFLGGGVLKSVLSHLEERKRLELGKDKLQTEITIAEINAELESRRAKKDVLLKESESAVQWLPRWLFGMTAAFYFMSVVIDSVFDLPGAVLSLPDNEAAIMGVIVGGLFLDAGATKISRALRK